jgi:hypothetical protein
MTCMVAAVPPVGGARPCCWELRVTMRLLSTATVTGHAEATVGGRAHSAENLASYLANHVSRGADPARRGPSGQPDHDTLTVSPGRR